MPASRIVLPELGGCAQWSATYFLKMISYKVIPKERYDDVIHHFRNFFYVEEPITKASGMCKKGEPNKYFEEYILNTLAENLSLMAVDENDQIAGVLLNGIMHKDDLEKYRADLEKCDDPNYKKIFTLVFTHNLSVDYFGKYQVDKVFENRLLSVDSNYRRLGIATQLINRSEALGREAGAKVLKADPSGKFSQKIHKEQGCEVLSEVFYKDYLDESGKQILNVEAPHDRFQLSLRLVTVIKVDQAEKYKKMALEMQDEVKKQQQTLGFQQGIKITN